jgi:hypothetical protein
MEMSSVVYLLRSPVEKISSALYTDADDEAVVIRVDEAAGPSSAQVAQMVKPGMMTSYQPGQFLTSGQLLDVLIHAQKIITL